jgi:hypothetical protein
VGAIATTASKLIEWYVAKQDALMEELQEELLDAMLDDDEEAEMKLMEERNKKKKGCRCPTGLEVAGVLGWVFGFSAIVFGGMGIMMRLEGMLSRFVAACWLAEDGIAVHACCWA